MQVLKKDKSLTQLNLIVIFIYFLSGCCSLIYEVIWRRMLKLILGNTTYATSITVAVFLGGLALGAYLVRKRADNIKNKLKVYALVEALISVTALFTPLLLNAVDGLYIFIFRSLSPQAGTIFLLQVFVSSIILLLPAVLMGSTLPILSGWLVKEAEQVGLKAGMLYSFNTLGALAGSFISGFYLIRLMGVHNTYYTAVVLNFLISGASYYLSRGERNEIIDNIHTGNQQQKKEEEGVKPAAPDLRARIIDLWLFASGFISLGYEIIWMRTVVHYTKAEIYVFSAILCVYLLGYSLGVSLGSRLLGRIKNKIMFTGFLLQLVGLCGIFYIPWLTSMPGIIGIFFESLRIFLLNQQGYMIHLFISFLLFFFPSVLMGLGFPFMIQMRRDYGTGTGSTMAAAYSINTAGCVLGALAAGFLLVPSMGSQRSIELLGLLGAASGFAAVFLLKKKSGKIFSSSVFLFCIIFMLMYPKTAFLKWINISESGGTRPTRLVNVIEGINTTASVHKFLDDNTSVISTAGINVAGDTLSLRQTQKVQGHIPIILHGKPQKVLTVGFGSGELTKTLTFHKIPEIYCVEIAPEMVWMAKKYFTHINLGSSLEEKVRIIFMDAKNYMHLSDEKYDVIMNDSTYPGYFAESSSLYTREYFMDGKRLLNEGGVYSTWVPIRITTLSLMSIIKTFNEVFENTIFVYPHNTPGQHILLVGQKKAHKYSYSKMQLEYNKEEVMKSLEYIGIRNMGDVFGFILTDNRSLERLTLDYPVNTDDFPAVEFDVDRGRSVLDPHIETNNYKLILENTSRINYSELFSFEELSPAQKDETLRKMNKQQEADNYLLKSFLPGSFQEKMQNIDRALKITPGNPDILFYKKMLLEAYDKK